MNKEQYKYDISVQLYNRNNYIKKIEDCISKLQLNANKNKKRIANLQLIKNNLLLRNKESYATNILELPPKLQTSPRSNPLKNTKHLI
jgi:hypothetical protein